MSIRCEVAPPTVRPHRFFRARQRTLSLGRRTVVMGVVNVTPDSFFEGSRYPDAEGAVRAALRMVDAGAKIIDVGGESTRPGARPLPVDQELDRVLPVIETLRPRTEVLLSIDTRRAAVAEKAIERGADLVNDVTALGGDPAMAELVGSTHAGLVLMHMKGTPETMQENPQYQDVMGEIAAFLGRAIEAAERCGVPPDAIMVDPGIGFGKTLEHNLVLLNRLGELSRLGKPILVGTSRKGFLGTILNQPPSGRLIGTMATVAAAILRGADAVRVHDVAEACQAARVADAISNEGLERVP